MIDVLERNLDDIVLRIVGHAEQELPLRLDLVAETERGNLDLGALAGKHLGHGVEIGAPLRLLEFLDHDLNLHGRSTTSREIFAPIWQAPSSVAKTRASA